MLPITLALLAAIALPQTSRFEIASNKPFVQATVNGSEPQWFILDTGCRGNSMIARDCADRLKLKRGVEEKTQVGAGSGVDVGISMLDRPVLIGALGDTITVAEPIVITLRHIAQVEGRRVDGLVGGDFLARHVVQIDYAKHQITLRDTTWFPAPDGSTVVPFSTDTGWPVVEGTVTTPGGKPVPCHLIVDTGVRTTVTLFRPFSARHGLYETSGNLRDFVTGFGVGGVSRGDVGRLETMTLGPASFARPVATFSHDTTGIFSFDGPDGIVGGELLRRHRVTFDYAHGRMILEPYADAAKAPFEYDMCGLFIATEPPDYAKIRILAVHPETPAAAAGLQSEDELVSIDGQRAPKLTLDHARTLLRSPGVRKIEVRRDGKLIPVRVEARRLV